MNDPNFLVTFIKGLIYTSIYTYEFDRAIFWKKIFDKVNHDDSRFIIEQHIIFRLATSTEVPDDMQIIGRDAMNKLSVEHPDVFVNMKNIVDKLNELIK